MALTARISLIKQLAELLDDGVTIAERHFEPTVADQALFDKAVSLAANHDNSGVIQLLWPERAPSLGNGTQ